MLNTLDLLYSLKGSYSGAFVLFWGLILISCGGLSFLQLRNAQWPSKIDRALYGIFGALMIAFTVFRPIGLTPDDDAYVNMYTAICPMLTCDHWVLSARDWGWYGLVGLFKSFYDSPRVMLVIGALALFTKLLVVFSLSKKRMLALALFFGVFYQVQDLTALRVSLSLAFFMGGLWLIINRYRWQGILVLFSSFVFHKQAVVSPLIALGSGLRKKFWIYPLLVLLPVLITLMGLYPHIQIGVDFLNSKDLLSPSLLEGLNSYLDLKKNGYYANWRVIPVSLFPVILLMVFLGKPAFDENKEVYIYASASCILACWFLWGFADIPVAQVRFFEYFALPMVLLAGNCRGRWWEIGLVLIVSSAFIYRYNVWTQLFAG